MWSWCDRVCYSAAKMNNKKVLYKCDKEYDDGQRGLSVTMVL